MRARDLAYETLAALDANRGRSILTVLGIVIGIAAVIAMTALIGGVRQSMIDQYGLSQARMVSMWCYYDREMNAEDVDALAKEMGAYYEAITPVTGTSETVVVGKVKKDAQINGVYAEYSEIQNLKFTQGRFFTKREVEEEARVVVIEQSALKTLFESQNVEAVGKTIHIGNDDFTVVGVIENTSSVGMDDWITVNVPYTTCIKRLNAWSDVSTVYGLAREGSDMEEIAEYTEKWLAHHFEVPEDERESSIYVLTMDSIIKQLDTMIGSFQALMLAVASVSLLVGGIGIMNMMLTNVTERIREIGLRKALGARRGDITGQFLLEAVCLTLIGGIIGILVGFGAAYLLADIAGGAVSNAVAGSSDANITPTIDMQAVMLATAICVGIGIVFGYYPAHRAAKLDPVESLRYQ